MGLDMYLTAEKYISANDYQAAERQRSAPYLKLLTSFPADIQELFEEDPIGASIEMPVGYWRKANQIHAWFVAYVQDGRDECQTSYVSEEALKELQTLCQQLLANRDTAEAENLLPPQVGFFFGGYEIDEYYWQDLERTVDICDRALKLQTHGFDIHYHSSW